MALTIKGRLIEMAAANDVISWTAMMGTSAGSGVYKTKVNAITVIWAATATAVVLRVGGTGGVIFFNDPGTANKTTIIAFSEPQEFDDLAVTVLPSGATVVVLTA